MYNFETKYIKNFNEIEVDNKEYIFKGYSFAFQYKKSNNLIVSFHGAMNIGNELPIYRFYDYNFENSDCLCLFDEMLRKYKDKQLLLSWYLIENNEDIYREIIENIIKINMYDKVIFCGSSGGGYPAVKYASIFNKNCLIAASQLYLEKYVYFKHFINKTNFNKIESSNIRNLITKDNKPSKIHVYQNIYDMHHYEEHILPFVELCKNNEVNIICNFFEHTDEQDMKKKKKSGKKGYFEGWEHHGGKYNIPKGETWISIFKSLYSIEAKKTIF